MAVRSGAPNRPVAGADLETNAAAASPRSAASSHQARAASGSRSTPAPCSSIRARSRAAPASPAPAARPSRWAASPGVGRYAAAGALDLRRRPLRPAVAAFGRGPPPSHDPLEVLLGAGPRREGGREIGHRLGEAGTGLRPATGRESARGHTRRAATGTGAGRAVAPRARGPRPGPARSERSHLRSSTVRRGRVRVPAPKRRRPRVDRCRRPARATRALPPGRRSPVRVPAAGPRARERDGTRRVLRHPDLTRRGVRHPVPYHVRVPYLPLSLTSR